MNNVSNEQNGNYISTITPAASAQVLHVPDGSQEHLVPVRSRLSIFKKKRVYGIKAISFLIILIILLILTVIILSVLYAISNKNQVKTICESFECIRAAATLAMSMDKTADPCTDFYQFTCGHWSEEHPKPDSKSSHDWFLDRQDRVIRQIRTFLQNNASEDEPIPVQQSKDMYKACMDVDKLNELKFQPIFEFLDSVGLPRIPHYFNLTEIAPDDFQFDWLSTIVNIKRRIRKDVIIGFAIYPDPINRTNNRLCMGSPSNSNSLPSFNPKIDKYVNKFYQRVIMNENSYYDDEEYVGHDFGYNNDNEYGNYGNDDDDDDDDDDGDEKVKIVVYRAYAHAVIKNIILSTNITQVPVNFDEILTEAVKIYWNISNQLQKLEKLSNETMNNTLSVEDFFDMTVDEIQSYTDNHLKSLNYPTFNIWRQYIELMFNGTGVTLDLDEHDQILLDESDLEYMRLVAEYLAKIPHIILEFYTWWAAIENMVMHTTSEIRELRERLYKLLTNVEGTRVRSYYCATSVNSLMGMAVSYAIIDKKFLVETKPKVQTMLDDIRTAFKQRVKQIKWMDKETKEATIAKCDSMHSLIGFPEWLLNRKHLEQYYYGLEINSTQHLRNMINVIELSTLYMLKRLHVPNRLTWATVPTDVNAFHAFQMNAITVPMAILQYPFYYLGLEALNYGAIGSILGHELTHGFDDTGREFDRFGNLRNWWTERTIEEYVNRTKCFVKQYKNFYIPELDIYIDGERTLGENIADNGGLAEAIQAYKLYQKRHGREPLLPGFEEYTHMQLLFIAFGNIWCETLTSDSLWVVRGDTHCPGKIRLHGVISNTEEFAKAFKCPKGSPMNPVQKRCRIW